MFIYVGVFSFIFMFFYFPFDANFLDFGATQTIQGSRIECPTTESMIAALPLEWLVGPCHVLDGYVQRLSNIKVIRAMKKQTGCLGMFRVYRE